MGKRITWWPLSMANNMPAGTIVLMRYDWPDERIYQVGMYDPTRFGSWHSGRAILSAPDYYTAITDDVLQWLKIPQDAEFTYNPKPAAPEVDNA